MESLRDFLKSLRFIVNLSRIPKSYLSHELTLMERLGYGKDFLDTEKAGGGWAQQKTPICTLSCYHLLLWWLSVTTLAVQSQKTRSRAATVPYPSYRLNWEKQNWERPTGKDNTGNGKTGYWFAEKRENPHSW